MVGGSGIGAVHCSSQPMAAPGWTAQAGRQARHACTWHGTKTWKEQCRTWLFWTCLTNSENATCRVGRGRGARFPRVPGGLDSAAAVLAAAAMQRRLAQGPRHMPAR